MKDRLEVGMYVRFKKGIVKINEVIDNGVITYEDDFGREWVITIRNLLKKLNLSEYWDYDQRYKDNEVE